MEGIRERRVEGETGLISGNQNRNELKERSNGGKSGSLRFKSSFAGIEIDIYFLFIYFIEYLYGANSKLSRLLRSALWAILYVMSCWANIL